MSKASLLDSEQLSQMSTASEQSICSEDSQSLEDCINLVKAITPQALVQIATDVRGPQTPAVTVSEKPFAGSYNLVYVITFADGSKWAARVPKHGTVENFGESQAATMQYELELLRVIKEKTTVPVPQIFYYDTTVDNAFGAPFSLCSWLSGTPACYLWHCEEGPTPLKQRRLRILDSVAEAMAQLSFLTNPLIGLPITRLGQEGFQIIDTQPLRARDDDKELQFLLHHAKEMKDDDPNPVFFCESGPFASTAEYLKALVERQGFTGTKASRLGERRMLDIIIEAIDMAEKQKNSTPEFVITHTDLDTQNILIDEDGTLTGILDWDGIRTGPWQLGCAAYPAFLSRDFNPREYEWWSSDEHLKMREDSPANLRELRKTYRSFFEKHAGNYSKYTTNSHLYRNIEKACTQRHLTSGIINKLTRICIKEDMLIENSDYDKSEEHGELELHDIGLQPKGDRLSHKDPLASAESSFDTATSDASHAGSHRRSVSQDSIASTIYEEMVDALTRFGTWLGLPFVIVAHFVAGVVNKKRKRPIEEHSLLESAELAESDPQTAGQWGGKPMEPDNPVQQPLPQDPVDTEGPFAVEEEGEEEVEEDEQTSEPPPPSNTGPVTERSLPMISPNDAMTEFTMDLFEALGRDEVGENNIAIIRNRFAEVLSSDEICEEWGLEDRPWV